MKKTIFTFILAFTICFCTKAQITTIELSLASPCATLSLNTNEDSNDFTIYPNPSNGIINIAGNFNQIESIKIYDLKGSLVFTSNLSKNKETSTYKILNVDHLQNGIYVLSYKIDNRKITKKLIINKQ
jgi:hypothetical protein